jgi:hypothetical protein
MEHEPKRRGPKAGSTSFSKVKLSDLNEYFGPQACVMISRKFLENCGLTIKSDLNTVVHEQTEQVIKTVESQQEKIAYSLTSFNQ